MKKTTNFYVHSSPSRLWMALAFALLLAWIALPSAGAASSERPAEVPTRPPPSGEPDVGEPYLVKDINATTSGYLEPENLIDNDGTYDWLDAFVTDASETADSDGDGIGDNADTDPDTDLELIALQEVFDAYFCFGGSVEKVSDTLYSFSCAGPAGHSTGAKIERFNDAETAKAEFVTLAGSTPLESFKCYTAYSWLDDSSPPIQSVYHSWLVDQWIVTSNTQDDTPYGFASARGTSFLVYQAAVGQGLIEGCIDTFFPMVAGG